MKTTIIGLVGPIASGKSVIAKYLGSQGFFVTSLSDRVREEAVRRGVEPLRSNLQDIGNDLRSQHGNSVLAELTLASLPELVEYVVVDSIRNPGELQLIKNEPNSLILGINADTNLRKKWYLDRAFARHEDSITPEDFDRADARDWGIGESDSGQRVGDCLVAADVTIHNAGDQEFLREIAREIIQGRFNIRLEGGYPYNLERAYPQLIYRK